MVFWVVAAAANVPEGQGENVQYNIVLMVSDDQRWDELSLVQLEQGRHARFPFLKTPRLDALAAEGVRFRNAFVTTSLCSPSRSAILTGQYNHTNGVTDNHTYFKSELSWAIGLRDVGYRTAFVGKWHHSNQWGRPGFDYTATYKGHGRYNNATFRVNGEAVESKGYVDERSVDYAIDFLESKTDEPFAMMIGFKAVHQPWTPMEKHLEDYGDQTIELPPSWNVLAPHSSFKFPKGPKVRRYWSDIARSQVINGIDQNVGRILDALDRLDLAKNTLVIFTSDNGYHLGEHGSADKRTAYEESMRVPLLVRFPQARASGSVSDELVLNIDIAPTILDVAKQEVPSAMQGRSLQLLVGGAGVPWRDAFLYEYFPRVSDTAAWFPPAILAVRTATHKLVTYPGHPQWRELFDLRTDPTESHNVARYEASAGLLAQMCNRLQALVAETGFLPRSALSYWPEALDYPSRDQSHRPPLAFAAC